MTGIKGIPYILKDGLWQAKGRAPLDPFDYTANFPRFTPGSECPIGFYDDSVNRNVGPRVLDFSTLEVVTGDMTVNAGDVISKKNIFGRINFNGAAEFVDCWIHGPALADIATFTGNYITAIVNGNYNGRGSKLSFCLIDGTGYENQWMDAIRGGNLTVEYSEVLRGIDGWGMVTHGNGKLYCSRVHDGFYTSYWSKALNNIYPGSPTSPSDRRTHCDGVQIQGYSGWEVVGNYIGGQDSGLSASTITYSSGTIYRDVADPVDLAIIQQADAADDYQNSCVIFTNNTGVAIGALVEYNWFQGGAASVNLRASGDPDLLAGVIVRNNKFFRPQNSGSHGYQIFKQTTCAATLSNNVWEDTGLPVTVATYT